MKKLLILGIISGSILFKANGQEKFTLRSQNYIGILEGGSGSYLQFHSVNGLQYKKWFGGIGVGLDHYYLRSIPLFFSLIRDIPVRKNIFYVSADGGVNFPWENDANDSWGENNYSTSYYWSSGFGYKIPIHKKNNLLFHVGYSFKHLKNDYTITFPCLIPPCPESKQEYNYYFRRLSLKAGWMF